MAVGLATPYLAVSLTLENSRNEWSDLLFGGNHNDKFLVREVQYYRRHVGQGQQHSLHLFQRTVASCSEEGGLCEYWICFLIGLHIYCV